MHTFNDPILDKIVKTIPYPEVESTHDVFHDLLSCLIEQQIHYRSTKRIFAKALERAGIDHITLDNFHLIEEHALPAIKLSTGKYEAMSAFVEFWKKNKLDFNELSDQEVMDELSSIKGIGKWTIDMILLYTLKRENVFPVDDFHLKQIMVALYNLDPNTKLKAQMLDVASNWKDKKSLAALYLLSWKKYQLTIK